MFLSINLQINVSKFLNLGCILSCLILTSCQEDEPRENYLHCSASINHCKGFEAGTYCLFGLKWGQDQSFEPGGIETIGPQSPGGIITYSFVTERSTISSGLNDDLLTVPFDNKGACARDQARAALAAWEQYANLSFEELDDDSPSDIKFIAADGVVEALGNPNYELKTCHGLSGRVIFSGSELPCEAIYSLCLHEIGHVLGLGHVNSITIMGTALSQGIDSLQPGDIAGIQAIYGPK